MAVDRRDLAAGMALVGSALVLVSLPQTWVDRSGSEFAQQSVSGWGNMAVVAALITGAMLGVVGAAFFAISPRRWGMAVSACLGSVVVMLIGTPIVHPSIGVWDLPGFSYRLSFGAVGAEVAAAGCLVLVCAAATGWKSAPAP
jgi:hypothetical protein